MLQPISHIFVVMTIWQHKMTTCADHWTKILQMLTKHIIVHTSMWRRRQDCMLMAQSHIVQVMSAYWLPIVMTRSGTSTCRQILSVFETVECYKRLLISLFSIICKLQIVCNSKRGPVLYCRPSPIEPPPPPGRSTMVLKTHCRPSPIAELPPYHFNRYRFYLYIFILLILWKNWIHNWI